MEWGDVLTIVLVLVCVWTFVPRHIRFTVRSVISPLVRTLLDALHEGAGLARKAITHVAYRGLLGVPVPQSVMVKSGEDEDEDEDIASGISLAKLNSEIPEIPQRVGEIQGETFTLGETEALARLVASGKLGLTDAVKIGAGAVSGEKYQKRSREIKAAVARIEQRYPQRTPEQDALRRELGIQKR